MHTKGRRQRGAPVIRLGDQRSVASEPGSQPIAPPRCRACCRRWNVRPGLAASGRRKQASGAAAIGHPTGSSAWVSGSTSLFVGGFGSRSGLHRICPDCCPFPSHKEMDGIGRTQRTTLQPNDPHRRGRRCGGIGHRQVTNFGACHPTDEHEPVDSIERSSPISAASTSSKPAVQPSAS